MAGCLVTHGDGGLPAGWPTAASDSNAPSPRPPLSRGDLAFRGSLNGIPVGLRGQADGAARATGDLTFRIAWREIGEPPWQGLWQDTLWSQGWSRPATVAAVVGGRDLSIDLEGRSCRLRCRNNGEATWRTDLDLLDSEGLVLLSEPSLLLVPDPSTGALDGSPRPAESVFVGSSFLNDLLPTFRRAGVRWDRRRSCLSPADSRCRIAVGGLLGDEIASSPGNLLHDPCAFSSSRWKKAALHVVEDQGIAPDGSRSADLLVPDPTPGWHYLLQACADAPAATRLSGSVWLKGSGSASLQIATRHGLFPMATVDLTLGTMAGPNHPSRPAHLLLTDAGDGWRRLAFTVDAGAGSAAPALAIFAGDTRPGDGRTGILVWGAMLECADAPAPFHPGRGPAQDLLTLAPMSTNLCSLLLIHRPWGRDGAAGRSRPILVLGDQTMADPGLGLLAGTIERQDRERHGAVATTSLVWRDGLVHLFRNGLPCGSYSAAAPSPTAFHLGSHGTGPTYQGDLAALGWERSLTDSEVQVATLRMLGHIGHLPTVCWGDSLTDGVPGQIPYPDLLSLEADPLRQVENQGLYGKDSRAISAAFLADPGHGDLVLVLWLGRNNSWEPDRVLADLGSMIEAMPEPRRFLILSMIKGEGEGIGTTAHARLDELNRRFQEQWPERFLDISAPLMSAGDPASPTDQADLILGIVPGSLRCDHLHLTTAGNRIVAASVAAKLVELGW